MVTQYLICRSLKQEKWEYILSKKATLSGFISMKMGIKEKYKRLQKYTCCHMQARVFANHPEVLSLEPTRHQVDLKRSEAD